LLFCKCITSFFFLLFLLLSFSTPLGLDWPIVTPWDLHEQHPQETQTRRKQLGGASERSRRRDGRDTVRSGHFSGIDIITA
jgi:hypothetical protein